MILYTMMPHELVFPTTDDEFKKQTVVNGEGFSLVVEPVSGSECRVVSLISSNPQHYLDSKYSPGQIIPMEPQV